MTPQLPNFETSREQIEARLRAIGRQNAAVRTTRPDWRLRTRTPNTAKTQAKIRRKQAHESRKRNR